MLVSCSPGGPCTAPNLGCLWRKERWNSWAMIWNRQRAHVLNWAQLWIVQTRRAPTGARSNLWREEPLDPAGQERFVQYAQDRRPLSRVALKQLRQEGAQLLGVVERHGRVGATDDLQDQVLHVAGLKLRRKAYKTHSCPLQTCHYFYLCYCIIYLNFPLIFFYNCMSKFTAFVTS